MESTIAIVAGAPTTDHKPGSNWSLETIKVPTELKEGEVLVEMCAVGVCHTDLSVTSSPSAPEQGFIYPKVAGHEGAGHVKALGPNLAGGKKGLSVGDPVLLSFTSCESCHYCGARRPASCEKFMAINLFGEPNVFETDDANGQGIVGKFFGQSSFARLSVVQEGCILPVKDLIRSEDELKLFAPLGCGLQTGAGAVMNTAKAGKDDTIMVLGLGGVGLAAIMAANIIGCKQIIAVDRVPSRLRLAKSFGATHILDTTGVEDMTSAMKQVTGGNLRPTIIIEATGAIAVVKAAYHAIAQQGTMIFVDGPPDLTQEFAFPIVDLLGRSISLKGCVEGGSYPEEFIPKLIKHYRDGRFPMEKITKYYPVDDFKTAVHDMHTGETVKPVLIW